MELSSLQEKIIESIYKKEFRNSEYTFKHMLEDIFSNFFEERGIKLTETSLELYGNNLSTKDVQKLVNNFCDLYFLIKKLEKEEYLFFIPANNINAPFSFKVNGKVKFSDINLTPEELAALLKIINSKFYISGKLNDLVKRGYKSKDQIALKWTQIALFASIAIGLIGIIVNIFVSTTIKFHEDVKIENVKIIEVPNIKGADLVLWDLDRQRVRKVAL